MKPMKPMTGMTPMDPMKPLDSGESWWPKDLGEPSSSGAQNDMRYAFFPAEHRLLVERNDKLTIYDSGDHEIGGVSQQQSGTRSLAFRSQHGEVSLEELTRVD